MIRRKILHKNDLCPKKINKFFSFLISVYFQLVIFSSVLWHKYCSFITVVLHKYHEVIDTAKFHWGYFFYTAA